ncbi:MAG: hypothetical protein DRN81_03060 [Thermoproteota archaeon]|nr:MAG: hypothetical protein DRN81_03060 [Candidatus Korarchaeota archaeon]
MVIGRLLEGGALVDMNGGGIEKKVNEYVCWMPVEGSFYDGDCQCKSDCKCDDYEDDCKCDAVSPSSPEGWEIQVAVNDLRAIILMCVELPDKVRVFVENVRDSAFGMLEYIDENDNVTSEQLVLIDKWSEVLEKWDK